MTILSIVRNAFRPTKYWQELLSPEREEARALQNVSRSPLSILTERRFQQRMAEYRRRMQERPFALRN